MKDRNGNDLSTGDKVIVEGTIGSINDGGTTHPSTVVVRDSEGDGFTIPADRVTKVVPPAAPATT